MKIDGMWKGETVAILGNGASLADDLAVMPRPVRSIAVNRAVSFAPWADMLVSIDGNWPAEGDSFKGIKIVGVPCDTDAHYVNLPHEVVRMKGGKVLHIRNNAISAIRIAAQAGASKIVLVGFDAERYEEIHVFEGFAAGLEALIAELNAKGITVERYVRPVVEAESPQDADATPIKRKNRFL